MANNLPLTKHYHTYEILSGVPDNAHNWWDDDPDLEEQTFYDIDTLLEQLRSNFHSLVQSPYQVESISLYDGEITVKVVRKETPEEIAAKEAKAAKAAAARIKRKEAKIEADLAELEKLKAKLLKARSQAATKPVVRQKKVSIASDIET